MKLSEADACNYMLTFLHSGRRGLLAKLVALITFSTSSIAANAQQNIATLFGTGTSNTQVRYDHKGVESVSVVDTATTWKAKRHGSFVEPALLKVDLKKLIDTFQIASYFPSKDYIYLESTDNKKLSVSNDQADSINNYGAVPLLENFENYTSGAVGVYQKWSRSEAGVVVSNSAYDGSKSLLIEEFAVLSSFEDANIYTEDSFENGIARFSMAVRGEGVDSAGGLDDIHHRIKISVNVRNGAVDTVRDFDINLCRAGENNGELMWSVLVTGGSIGNDKCVDGVGIFEMKYWRELEIDVDLITGRARARFSELSKFDGWTDWVNAFEPLGGQRFNFRLDFRNVWSGVDKTQIDYILLNGKKREDIADSDPSTMRASRLNAVVGQSIFLRSEEIPDSAWTLFLGEKNDRGRDRVQSGSGDSLWRSDSGLEIKYYKPGIYQPTVQTDQGSSLRLAEPIIVRCFESQLIDPHRNESPEDCDGDGLLNEWEIAGFGRMVSSSGSGRTVEILSLDKYRVNPLRPDLLIEVDIVGENTGINESNLDELVAPIVDLFNANPARSPINLVIEYSEDVAEVWLDRFLDSYMAENPEFQEECDAIALSEDVNIACDQIPEIKLEAYRFGTEANQCDGAWANEKIRDEGLANPLLCAARGDAYRAAFRHAFIGNSDTLAVEINSEYQNRFERLSGVANVINGSFITNHNKNITGSTTKTNAQSRDSFRKIFLHELGHTLGLGHGGNEHVNCKPNYLSVMNYAYALNSIGASPLDFSRGTLRPLSTNAMNEEVPFSLSPDVDSSMRGVFDERYILERPRKTPIFISSTTHIKVGSQSIDWNVDGSIYDGTEYISRDVFCNFRTKNSEDIIQAAFPPNGRGFRMNGHNDWMNLQLDQAEAVNVWNGFAQGPLTSEIESMRERILLTDIDMDGLIGVDDNCLYDSNSDQTDGDGDGVGAVCDICPFVYDAEQTDTDGDGIGDACDESSRLAPLILQNDVWVQFGIPLDTGSFGIGQLFSNDLDISEFGQTWSVLKYFGPTEGYRQLSSSEIIEPGVGYWIKQITGSTLSIRLPFSLGQTMPEASDACPYGNENCYVIDFDESEAGTSWQIISNPTNAPMNISKLFFTLVTNAGVTTALVDEDVNEFRHSGGIYVYDSSIGGYQFRVAGDMLQPWEAGWVGVLPAEMSGSEITAGFVP